MRDVRLRSRTLVGWYKLAPMLRRVSPALPLALMLGACGNSAGNGFPDLTEPMITTVPPGSSSSGGSSSSSSGGEHDSTSTSSSGGAASTDGSGGPKLDMPVPDGGAPPPIGCQGKIDFIFAISASGTMKDQQEQLIASFPGFIGAIKEQLPDFDVHILSADADAFWAIPDCSLCTESCDPQGDEPLCGVAITPCDKSRMGAGVTFPVGYNASNRRCDLYGGNRYIVSGEPKMEEMFDCIARVGTYGGDGLVAEAMVAALDPFMNGPNGCNTGFLRDDALLVVVLIKDTYDQLSEGTPADWIEALRTAKHGDDDAFTVLVLATDVDDPLCEGNCLPQCNITKNPLRLLVEGVKHGFIGGICEPSFTPFFEQAVGHIVQLCDSFVVPQ